MSIQSPYDIVFTPEGGADITLCESGGWLETLPEFSASQELFEADGISLANAFFRPLGQVAVTIELVSEEDHPDLITALDAYLSAGEGGILQAVGSLTFSPASGRAFTFANAVVATEDPDLPSGQAATLTRAFTILASLPNITITPP